MDPNTLYLTLSLPRLPPYQTLPADRYPPYLPTSFDAKTYETAVASGQGGEEFGWGVYWIDARGNGTLYTVQHRETNQDDEETAHPLRRTFIPPRVIRFDRTVVGIIRVLHLPLGVEHGMEGYLAWLASLTATSATRSFIWAVAIYARCRKHVVRSLTGVDGDESEEFEVNGFLGEVLARAYREVGHALMGRGCVPIWNSEYGVEALEAGEGDEEDEGESCQADRGESGWNAEKEADMDKTWPRLVDAYGT